MLSVNWGVSFKSDLEHCAFVRSHINPARPALPVDDAPNNREYNAFAFELFGTMQALK
jgi:hypothetical protein